MMGMESPEISMWYERRRTINLYHDLFRKMDYKVRLE